MIPEFVLANLSSWFLQVLLVATAGAVLPLLFRIRHPRSQLAYIHAVLGLCLVLPLIQTWQESLAIVAGSFQEHREVAAVSWSTVAVWVLLAGIVAKLGWLGLGLYQLRCYRKSAVALFPLPDSIREARQLTRADAIFAISRSISGPATLGHVDPIVLLPESFLSLDAESQRSIACHELLHVQRRDWFVTVLEEITGALLWFNPGVWWMLAQARLAREQLVDSEVVNIIAREPYIEALLSMAVVSRKRWALPAASFFTQGHLIHRMRLLVKGPNRSLLRLCVCYTSVVILLIATMGTVMFSFPLTSKSLVVLAAQPVQSITVRPPAPAGRVVPRVRLPEEFTIAVPPPADGNRDVMYFVEGGNLVEPEGTLRIPPPPPPPPPLTGGPVQFGFLAARGIRMVRPGDVATPEEIQRLREAFGGHVQVEIDQAENGVVQRVSVQVRRLSDEADTVRSFVAPLATEPAAAVDRSH
jgi:beta-lactamase regulating signal transducer with metallopeptidase domain